MLKKLLFFPKDKSIDIRYKKLFDTANDAIFLMDKDIFIECNKKTLKMFGCDKKSDIVGHAPYEFSPEKQPDGRKSINKAKEYIKEAFSGKPLNFYWKHTKKNGDLFDAEVSLNHLKIDGKDYVQALVRDISERVEIEKKLKESEQKFSSIVKNAQAVIFMVDENFKFVISEGLALESLGLKPGQVLGMSALEMYKDYPDVVNGLKDAADGKLIRKIIYVQDIYFDIFFSPYVDDNGKKGVIGMAIDITEEEKAKIELQEMDKTKTNFMNTAAHQLRTPAGAMRWMIEEIIDDGLAKKDSDLEKKINELYKVNLRMIDLINSLLDVVRIEQDNKKRRTGKIDLIKILKDVLKGLSQGCNKRGLRVTVTKSVKSLMVRANTDLLREAIENIVCNSIRYNREGGFVLIEVEKQDKQAIIKVANTGSIIPKKDQERIFQKFFRSEEAVQKWTDGSGLGLFLSKAYIERFGGTIEFESPKKFGEKSMRGDKYKGTVFTIKLPLYSKKS